MMAEKKEGKNQVVMPRKNLLYFGVWIAIVVISNTASAALIWSQGFESLPNGTIDGQGTTWFTNYDTIHTYAYTKENPSEAHSGNKYLEASRVDSGLGLKFGWNDDVLGMPHGGMLELSFWMSRNAGADWLLDGYALNDERVFAMANEQAGTSSSAIDILEPTSSTDWQETLAIVPADVWTNVFIQMNFDASTVEYRVKADSGNWQGWYDSGVAADYFRYFRFSVRNDTTIKYDDFELHTIPEPVTISLFGLSGLIILKKRK